MERGELWNRKGILRDRRRGVERPPRDRRRVVWLMVENQEVAVVCGWLVQCVGSQVFRCCGKEGTKKA